MTDDRQPQNREQRRDERFRPETDDASDATHPGPEGGKASAGRPDQDVVRTTGAGTGGATESDDRVKHHEGVHLGNQPNS